MSAVADIQNTVAAEFLADPRVEVVIVSQSEPESELHDFWTNLYLQGPMLFDAGGYVGGQLYAQPFSGLPFSRGFLIDPNQTVTHPFFGYNPDLIMSSIYGLILDWFVPGDVDGDGQVDMNDFAEMCNCLAGPNSEHPAYRCHLTDFDRDADVDLADLAAFANLLVQ